MHDLVPPHGRKALLPLLAPENTRRTLKEKAATLVPVPMSSREKSDLLLLAMGAYTPLKGFFGEADWRCTCEEMKLASGLFWPIPITLSVTVALAEGISIGDEVVLMDHDEDNVPMAILMVTDKYESVPEFECHHIFGTTDEAHPGVESVITQGPVNLGGDVVVFYEGEFPNRFKDLYVRPEESRALFRALNWSTVTAFQTRNPMHRSHEYLVKLAMDLTEGLFIHQVLGKLKPGDVPAEVRVKAIDTLIQNYFPKDTIIQAGYPIEMRYAGPREALLHALIRQNFGCSHLIIGRDHAGVADYYGPLDAQEIFDTLWEGALMTQPLKVGTIFYCKRCEGMASDRTCPHGPEERVSISGTRQREMLSNGEDVPPEISRPEVVAVLRDYYESLMN